MIVVDASVWVSTLIVDDVNRDRSVEWLVNWTRTGGRLAVPSIFLIEVAGAVARRTRLSDLGQRAVQDVRDHPAIFVHELDQQLVVRSASIAANSALRGADAIYVALAERLNSPLLTLDAEQQRRGGGVVRMIVPESLAT